MARIAGVDLPRNKNVDVALSYIYGVGMPLAKRIIAEAKINPLTKVKDLTEDEVSSIRKIIETNFKVEGDLRREVAQNIKRLIEIGSYRGSRHKKGLPSRGQRTHTNARTRKGKRIAIAGKKKSMDKT